MKSAGFAFLAGLLFAVGLALGGMTQPAKVVGFLDFFGDWDPSLAFVMGGAVIAHAGTRWIALRQRAPLHLERFAMPTSRKISPSLIGGAALFGVGWALAGFCPGPGLVSLPALGLEAWLFVATMAASMVIFDRFVAHRTSRETA